MIGSLGKIGCRPLFKRWTAKDYVQSGLSYLYDGIENAGWETHDGTARVWTNLVGNDAINLPTDNDIYFGDKFLHRAFTGNIETPLDITAISTTTELVLNYSSGNRVDGNNNGRFVGAPNPTRFEIYPVSLQGFSPSLYYKSQGDSGATVKYAAFQRDGWAGAWALAIVIDEDGYLTLIDSSNGQAFAFTNKPVDTSYYSGVKMILGNWRVSSVVYGAMLGDFYSVRRYSRVLTAAEIAANYAVDKLRFGLPT